jgi:hypothetical protein
LANDVRRSLVRGKQEAAQGHALSD